jgi:hypothetical protein
MENSSSILKLCHHIITHSFIQDYWPCSFSDLLSMFCQKFHFDYHPVESVQYPISRVTSDHMFLNRRARRTLHQWAYRLPVHTKQQLVVIASRCSWSFILIIIPDYRCPSIIVIYSQIPTSIILCSISVLFGLSKFQMNKWKKKSTKYEFEKSYCSLYI